MRKRLITPKPQYAPRVSKNGIDLEHAAVVEVTSEENEFPIELALFPGETLGWRAAEPGAQTIRLLFGEPQKVTGIALVFEEAELQRTQEFILRWSGNGEDPYREIVRQQWNFSPPNSTRETEDYRVELSGVTRLELIIVPDINRGGARASLRSLRVA